MHKAQVEVGSRKIRIISITVLAALLFASTIAVAYAETYVFVLKWGTAGSGDGQFYSPLGVAVDCSGNVYVTDASNHRIQKFTSNGDFVTKWGSGGSGDGQFNGPYGVAFGSSGNVYVGDTYNNRIQRFTKVPEDLNVVPEVPLGAAIALVSMVAAVAGFAGFKRFRLKLHSQ